MGSIDSLGMNKRGPSTPEIAAEAGISENDRNELLTRITNLRHKMHGRYEKMSFVNNSLMLTSILLSACITILSFFNLGIFAAILGVALTALLTIQKVWDFNQLDRFYKALSAHLDALETAVKFTHKKDEFEKELGLFEDIQRMQGNPPAGGGLDALQQMQTTLKDIKKT